MTKPQSIGFAIVLGLLGAVSSFAQNAALVGTVRDASQAVIPGATVRLTNIATGVELAATSDEMGSYEFPTVRPGNYSIKVEQAGFRNFVLQSLVLAVGERTRVDATLQVGAIQAAVTVEEVVATTVQTESSALGDVVPNRKIVEAP